MYHIYMYIMYTYIYIHMLYMCISIFVHREFPNVAAFELLGLLLEEQIGFTSKSARAAWCHATRGSSVRSKTPSRAHTYFE